MLIFFESLMMKCGSQMCLISIWIQGSHVHKARTGCSAALEYECFYDTCPWT